MSVEHGGRLRGELTPAQQRPQTPETQQGRPADARPIPFIREQQQRGEQSHEDLVEHFRQAIRYEQQELGALAKYRSPVHIIDAAFRKQVQYLFSDHKADQQRGEFFSGILHAWEVMAYAHYGKGAVNTGDLERHYAGISLSAQYERAKIHKRPHPEIIRLSDQLQIQILDAAAEAVDIPHHTGQAAFEIPPHLREYAARLRQARAARERRR